MLSAANHRRALVQRVGRGVWLWRDQGPGILEANVQQRGARRETASPAGRDGRENTQGLCHLGVAALWPQDKSHSRSSETGH